MGGVSSRSFAGIRRFANLAYEADIARKGLKEEQMRRALGATSFAMLIAFALVVGRAEAVVSGNEIWDNCQDSTKLQFCYGYILGVAQTHNVARPMNSKPFFCIPNEVQEQQVLDVVTSYITNHPERRQWPAPTLVIFALGEKFPCNK